MSYAKEKKMTSYFCSSSQESLWNRFPELIFLKLPIVVPQDNLYKPTTVISDGSSINDSDSEQVGVKLARLLLELGYVTIKSCNNKNMLTLGYPNNSVEDFVKLQIHQRLTSTSDVSELANEFLNDNKISSLFASANTVRRMISPKHHNVYLKESGYHVLLAQILMMIGAPFSMEEGSSLGYSDLLVVTSQNIYTIELKIIRSQMKITESTISGLLKSALNQISARDYTKNSSFIRNLVLSGRSENEIIEVGLVASVEGFEAYSYRPYRSNHTATTVRLRQEEAATLG
jgi:hypothetical protein